MSKTSKEFPATRRDEALIDRAVRRSVGMKFAVPSLRSMLRACGVYANVIAALVALGLPTAGGLRSAAGSAALAFESAVRSSRESTAGLPDLLTRPIDLTAVTESAGEIVAPVEVSNDAGPVEAISGVKETAISTPISEEPVQLMTGFESVE